MKASTIVAQALLTGCRSDAQKRRISPYGIGPGFAFLAELAHPDTASLLCALAADEGAKVVVLDDQALLWARDDKAMALPSIAAAEWLTGRCLARHGWIPGDGDVLLAMESLAAGAGQ